MITHHAATMADKTIYIGFHGKAFGLLLTVTDDLKCRQKKTAGFLVVNPVTGSADAIGDQGMIVKENVRPMKTDLV